MSLQMHPDDICGLIYDWNAMKARPPWREQLQAELFIRYDPRQDTGVKKVRQNYVPRPRI